MICGLEKQPKTKMLVINDAAMRATSLICNNLPIQARWQQKKKAIAFGSSLNNKNRIFPKSTIGSYVSEQY